MTFWQKNLYKHTRAYRGLKIDPVNLGEREQTTRASVSRMRVCPGGKQYHKQKTNATQFFAWRSLWKVDVGHKVFCGTWQLRHSYVELLFLDMNGNLYRIDSHLPPRRPLAMELTINFFRHCFQKRLWRTTFCCHPINLLTYFVVQIPGGTNLL